MTTDGRPRSTILEARRDAGAQAVCGDDGHRSTPAKNILDRLNPLCYFGTCG
jgi:hypothetical protein